MESIYFINLSIINVSFYLRFPHLQFDEEHHRVFRLKYHLEDPPSLINLNHHRPDLTKNKIDLLFLIN